MTDEPRGLRCEDRTPPCAIVGPHVHPDSSGVWPGVRVIAQPGDVIPGLKFGTGNWPTSWQVRQALTDAWEAGNCTGLDGWVGEDRGTQEPDRQAIENRERDVNEIINRLYPDPDTRCTHHDAAGQCLDHQGHHGDHQHPQPEQET